MLDDPIKYGLLAALAIALLTAAFTDLKSRRIANWLNGAIALAAPVFWWASDMALWPDIAIQLGLAVATFFGLSILFALKMMGGGDIKLLTALALWIAPEHFLKLLVMMALLGGVLTLVFGGWHIMRRQRDRIAIPYGVAIAAAGLWVIASFYIPASAITGTAG
ncbi:A24 family peptidase [Alteraurantiacibacter aquimixticola]|uniref:Peptidase n=1 Tax=Alteraurantiacibacter aquimixticola TaxID=2489173 RepID=A0A4T3F261_9SPHN|nr:prepilin peptidase [Alteraurantiacibacter aquimixticola]TIX51325.1 peptidase [Alteraurantiacibacter aquimixticola]